MDARSRRDRLNDPANAARVPWIRRCPGAPYFEDEDGRSWTPIGHNDALTWLTLRGLLGRQDVAGVERYLADLAAHGVTCLRVMLEYAEHTEGFFENPIGTFSPPILQFWDDLFALCARYGLRLFLTPFDTFWTWMNWKNHPYNRRNGGPTDSPARVLLCPETRNAIKGRLAFATERWGGTGTLFAWDLWNEIHPAQAEDSIDNFAEFITDISEHVRAVEMRLYGRSHPQTVSLFGPEIDWRPHLDFNEPILRHPRLDFANLHIYREGTIDDPRDTVAPALDMAEIVARSLREIEDMRPFFDSEHGPIHRFKDKHKTLAADFDEEYFRNMQWAHLAAGGAGGGMRWPNRHPHKLTAGMHEAQQSLARFLPLIDWCRFRRQGRTLALSSRDVAAVASGDEHQAVLWLVRTDSLTRRGMLRRSISALGLTITVPGLEAGDYEVTEWDTRSGRPLQKRRVAANHEGLSFAVALHADMAIAISRA